MARLAPVFVSLVLLGLGAAAAGENLIVNGGFEEVDPKGFAVGWEPVYWSNPHGKVEVVGEAREGQRCVRLSGVPTEQITDAGKRNNNLVGQKLAGVMGARKLTLRAWLRTEADGLAFCSLMTSDQDGKRLQYQSSLRYKQRTEWTAIEWRFTTDPETASAMLYLRNDGVGPVWFDDVTVEAAGDVLENDRVRVMLEPLAGARVRSFQIKASGEEKTVWEGIRPGGLAADIVPADRYPGLLRDAPYEFEVLEPNRRVVARYQVAAEELAGVVVEKEFSLTDHATLDVTLRVRNTADQPRRVQVRAQHCLRPTRGTFTWPCRDHLRAFRPPEHMLKASIGIDDLKQGWFGYADAESKSGMVLQFDLAAAPKALIYLAHNLYTIEWYYQPLELAAGASWETRYALTAVPGGAPIVAVAPDLAVGLAPLKLNAAEDYKVSLLPLRGARTAEVAATCSLADGTRREVAGKLSVEPAEAAALTVPCEGQRIAGLELKVRADSGAQSVVLNAGSLNDRPMDDAPAPPTDLQPFPAATNFFPFGEYLRGYVGPEAGTFEEFCARNLRAYRRNYFNTWLVGEPYCLGTFKKDRTSWLCELARKRRVKLFLRNEMLRRFERNAEGIQRELPPEEATRERTIARITANGLDLELRKAFAKAFGDVILAYDFSDEPGGEYIPQYMQLQNVYREVDPDHPVMTILNLDVTAFLPYAPIYYGDEYPIRNTGRRPWEVGPLVRFCATHTRAPVWVMLQAFGGRQEYTWHLPTAAETRLTTWLVIANGGKGLTYHGTWSPPCWRYNNYYFDSLCDSWEVSAPGWQALREAGRQLTAIGPSLLQTDVSADQPCAVECRPIGTKDSPYSGPAVTVGVLKERGRPGWFLVAVNQDLEQPRSATLTGDPKVVGQAVLVDLHDLQELGPAAAAKVTVSLAPGDGRVYYCGPAAAAAEVVSAVHGQHYQNELALYEIDAELAAANGADLTAPAAAAKEAAAAQTAGDGALAHRRMVAARAALAESIAAVKPLATALAQLQQTQDLLAPLAHLYKQQFDRVVPPESRRSRARGQTWLNQQDPVLQQYVDHTAQCFCDRMKLSDRVYRGEAQDVAADIAALLDRARRVHDQATSHLKAP